MNVVDELGTWRRGLVSLRYADGPARLSALVEWLDSEPLTHSIMEELRGVGRPLVQEARFEIPPPAGFPIEIAGVGAVLLDRCHGGELLENLAQSLGIQPSHDTTYFQPIFDEPMRRFVLPALDFIRDAVLMRLSAKTADNLIEQRLLLLNTDLFRAHWPETGDRAKRIAAALLTSDTDAMWHNIGNSVRDMLITFGQELAAASASSDMKAGDFKGVVRYIVRDAAGEGRFGSTLEALLVAAWDHSQSLTHRASSSRADAERSFVLAAIAIAELHAIVVMPKK